MDMVFALNFYNEVSNAITQHIFDVVLEAVQKVHLLGFNRVQASKCSPKVLRLDPQHGHGCPIPRDFVRTIFILISLGLLYKEDYVVRHSS